MGHRIKIRIGRAYEKVWTWDMKVDLLQEWTVEALIDAIKSILVVRQVLLNVILLQEKAVSILVEVVKK